MRQLIVLGVLIGVGAAMYVPTGHLQGQQQEAKELDIRFIPGLKRDPLNPGSSAFVATAAGSMYSNMYLLIGGGRHSVALATDDGVVLVDTKLPGWGQSLLDEIGLVTDHPVTMIINTSPLGAGSNAELPTAVDILAHENTRAEMARMDAFKRENARFLPNKTYHDTMSIPLKTVGELNGTNRVDLYHFGPAHSSGDTVVVFPSFGVALLGDLFPAKAVPVIDTERGGSAVAFPETLAKAVAGLRAVEKDIDILVPGRAIPPGRLILRWLTLNDLEEYADFNRDFLTAVKEAMSAGKTVDEAFATLTLPDKYEDYDLENARAYVEAIYAELQQ